MKKVVIVDTNFLIKNLGKIKDIVEELKNKEIEIMVPELVKDEFINIQLRKLKDAYNELEKLKKSYSIVRLKFKEQDNAIKDYENEYNLLFEQTFPNNIIYYKKEEMLNRVLERNRYKNPPFNSDPNSSDKGFKDTIIFLSIKDYLNETAEDDVVFYFATFDSAFIKNKDELEKEVCETTNKKLNILEVNEKNKLLKELDLEEETSEECSIVDVFLQSSLNVEEIRRRINELMDEFIVDSSYDYYGNFNEEKRFDITEHITNGETEKFLGNIDYVINKNIFSNEISVLDFFENKDVILSKVPIRIDVVKEISELYKKVKETEYKEAFITYVNKRINENIIYLPKFTITDDDLPF